MVEWEHTAFVDNVVAFKDKVVFCRCKSRNVKKDRARKK